MIPSLQGLLRPTALKKRPSGNCFMPSLAMTSDVALKVKSLQNIENISNKKMRKGRFIKRGTFFRKRKGYRPYRDGPEE